MNRLEHAEVYLRLRAETLLDPGHSAWREVETHEVAQLVAIAEALVALGEIDNTTFSSVFDDLELAGWLRHRMLGDLAHTRTVLADAFAPSGRAWPPAVVACAAKLAPTDGGEDMFHLFWLVRTPGGATHARFGAGSGADLTTVVVVDDRGASYKLEATEAPGLARVVPDPPSTIRRVELRSGARSVVADCSLPDQVRVERRPHETMTPAQLYLANRLGLLPHGVEMKSAHGQQLGAARPPWAETAPGAQTAAARARDVAAVAGALVDLGLLDGSDPLIAKAQSPGWSPGRQPAAPSTAPSTAQHSGSAPEPRAVGRDLGLQGVKVFVEGYVVTGRQLSFHVQLAEGPRRITGGFGGPPWFGVIDDQGRTYELGVSSADGKHIEVRLEPGLGPATRTARFFVDTPLESAWIDVDLQGLT